MSRLVIDKGNALCGAIFIGFGAFFAIQSLGLEIGTAFRMGPGYFPLLLAVILIIFGAIIFIQALRMDGEPIGRLSWRGMIFILPAPILFGVTVRGLGFVPALFLTALLAAFASQKMRPLTALLLAAGLTFFSTLIFVQGLGLPFRLFGPWLNFSTPPAAGG